VSRLTARNAVSELVKEGYLYRVHGQGTFVSKPRVETSYSRFTGFMEDMRKRGYRTHSKVLEASEISASSELQEVLQLEKKERVYKIARLRFANDEPIVIQEAYLPSKMCPGIIEEDLENNSLYEIMGKKYGIFIDHASDRLEAISATGEQAEQLGINEGNPILYFNRISFLKDETPVEFAKSWYRGDRYVFEIELRKSQEEKNL